MGCLDLSITSLQGYALLSPLMTCSMELSCLFPFDFQLFPCHMHYDAWVPIAGDKVEDSEVIYSSWGRAAQVQGHSET